MKLSSLSLMTIVQRALLMIFLVVTFPITSLGVGALEITQVRSVVVDVDDVGGALYSEVDNVIRAIESNHPITVVALVKTDTDTSSIPADKLPYVKLPGESEFIRMQSCTLEGRDARLFNCEKDTMLTPTGSRMVFDVCARGLGFGDASDNCNSGILYVDGEGPVLSGVPTDRVVTRDNEVTLRFSVRDITHVEEAENVCSGVASVVANDGFVDLGEVSFSEAGCTSPGIPECTCDQSVSGFVVDLSSFIDGEETTVCLSATDKLGNIGEESCFPVARDSRETVINSFSFQNSVGEPITQVSDSTTFYGAAIITVPPLFSITNVGVTFPGGADAATEFLLTCEAAELGSAGADGRTEGVYTCTTEGITARNTGSGAEVQANVRVLDSAGDEETRTFNIPLELDDSVPVLVDVYSPYRFGEESFLAEGDNIITLALQESGAGFASKNVYVTFTGADITTRSVDDCQLVGPEWHCTITIQPRGDVVTVTGITGQDDAGNAVDASLLPKSFRLDSTPPSFQGDVEIENRGSRPDAANSRIFAAGDSVMITAYFYDDSSIFTGDDAGRYASTEMRADVSDFSDVEGATELPPEKCEFKEDYHPYGAAEGDTEEVFSCSWYISSILAEQVSIGFMMKDIVGNEATDSKDENFILLFEEDVPTEEVGPPVARRERFDGELVPLGIAAPGEEVVDNWKPLDNFTQRTQINVDLLKVHDLPLMFETVLEPRPSVADKVNLLDLYLDPTSCMGDTEYLFEDSLRLIQPSRDSTTLWFWLKMRQGDPRLGDLGRNYLQLNCSIVITAEVDGELQEAEQENALITITFAANVQDLGAKLTEEIKELKKGILVRMEWMDTLNDIIDGVTKICNMLYMARELSAALDFINIPFQGVCRVLGPFCYQADAGMRQTVHTVDSITGQLFEYAYYICEFTACRISLFSDDLDITGKYNAQQAAGSLATSWLEDDTGREAVRAGYTPTEYHTEALAEDGVDYKDIIGSPYPYANPRDSIVWSTLTLCIPGILHNLQKLRNIECKFIKCLENNVEAGVPVSVCRLERTYATCMFVWGEIFHLIPFADWAKGFLRTTTDAINNVFGLLGIAFGFLCSMFGTETSTNEVSIIASSCRLVRFINVVNDFASMGEDIANAVGDEDASFVPGNDACEGVLADEDEEEEDTSGAPPEGGEGG